MTTPNTDSTLALEVAAQAELADHLRARLGDGEFALRVRVARDDRRAARERVEADARAAAHAQYDATLDGAGMSDPVASALRIFRDNVITDPVAVGLDPLTETEARMYWVAEFLAEVLRITGGTIVARRCDAE